MDDDDPIGGGTLVMTPQASPLAGTPAGEGPGHAHAVPAPVPAPADADRRVPRPPIFQVAPERDPEDTSIDELPTRLKEDSTSSPAASPDAPRNLHPAFAQTQLQPFGPPPAPTSEAPLQAAAPQAWVEPAGYPAAPTAPNAPLTPGATTLQGLGEVERIVPGGYPQAPFPHGGPGFIRPRMIDEISQTTADLSGKKLVLTPIAIGAAAGLLVTIVVVGVILLAREPTPPAVVASAPTVVASERATPSSAPTPTSAAPTASQLLPAPPSDADAKARAALEQLKTGIDYCVKSTIHVLPGASPAVPSSIAWLKSGPYASLKRDWASPFFNCTNFRIEEPMPFMIQWQVDVPNEKGTAVVWLDPNGDGTVDRAYGFKATLVKRDKVEFGPVEPIDVSRKVQRTR